MIMPTEPMVTGYDGEDIGRWIYHKISPPPPPPRLCTSTTTNNYDLSLMEIISVVVNVPELTKI